MTRCSPEATVFAFVTHVCKTLPASGPMQPIAQCGTLYGSNYSFDKTRAALLVSPRCHQKWCVARYAKPEKTSAKTCNHGETGERADCRADLLGA